MSRRPSPKSVTDDREDRRTERIALLKAQLLMELLRGRGVSWQECLEAGRNGTAAELLERRLG